MWRFIFVTFAFLGWAFYDLSGGADYAPSANSIQARALIGDTRPVPRPVRVQVTRHAIADAQDSAPQTVTRSLNSLSDLRLSRGEHVEIRLASADAADMVLPAAASTATEQRDRVLPATATASATAFTRGLSTADTSPTPEETVVPRPETEAEPDDLRRVTASAVNLRAGPGTQYDRIGRLTRGQDVRVLQDPGNGWIKLRVGASGRVGWMAERLVSAAK